VLFVPGQGGSYKQVRSVASEAHRMFENPAFFFDSDDPTRVLGFILAISHIFKENSYGFCSGRQKD
jgi:hypothetical protein